MRIVGLPILVVLVAALLLLQTSGQGEPNPRALAVPPQGPVRQPVTRADEASRPSAPRDRTTVDWTTADWTTADSCIRFDDPWIRLVRPRAAYVPSRRHVAQPAHSGSVLVAGAADATWVISLGRKNRVRVGFRYLIARGDSYVATIVIEDVQAERSVGRVLKDLSKSEIKAGDVVVSES